MELANTDFSLITETRVNNNIYLDSTISQANHTGDIIISHRCTHRKGGGLMCIQISGLNVQKVRTISKKHFMD